MRELIAHKVNPANDQLKVEVLDKPGAGGASHLYQITGYDATNNDSYDGERNFTNIIFQNGPIPEHGVNGITQEVLLAIVADRLQSFQAGPFACRENALALTKVEEALHWLHHRTRAREARGVEGTHNV